MNVLLVSEGKHEEAGALESLIKRVLPKISSCSWDRVSNSQIEIQRGKGQGFFKRAMRWMRETQKRGYDALILVIDHDGDDDRITELNNAQESKSMALPRALGIAIRSFDAWMLADERTLTTTLGILVQTQPSPEANANPKASCAELLKKSACGISQRDLYATVAQTIDVPRLEQRCPKGFGVFAARLRKL